MPKKRFDFSFSLNEKAGKNEAEILIYSVITDRKWRDDDPSVTATEFNKLLKKAKEDGAKNLRLRINSPGGSVWQAVAMKTMLDMSDFENIYVDIEGLCASAATFFVCAENAKVRIARGSEFMIHNPYLFTGGTAAALMKEAERLTKMENDQHTMYAKKSGQTEEQIKKWMDAETWFTAAEAVEKGFCDEIMEKGQAAACVDAEGYNLMQEIYTAVPESVTATGNVSTAEAQVASETATENKNQPKEEIKHMDHEEITVQTVQEQAPATYEEIYNAGVRAERQRMQDIDALTDEGFEEAARMAKENGTTAADFLREIVTSRAQKKKDFMKSRTSEAAKAQEVTGGADADNDVKNDVEELTRFAKEAAAFADELRTAVGGSMF